MEVDYIGDGSIVPLSLNTNNNNQIVAGSGNGNDGDDLLWQTESELLQPQTMDAMMLLTPLPCTNGDGDVSVLPSPPPPPPPRPVLQESSNRPNVLPPLHAAPSSSSTCPQPTSMPAFQPTSMPAFQPLVVEATPHLPTKTNTSDEWERIRDKYAAGDTITFRDLQRVHFSPAPFMQGVGTLGEVFEILVAVLEQSVTKTQTENVMKMHVLKIVRHFATQLQELSALAVNHTLARDIGSGAFFGHTGMRGPVASSSSSSSSFTTQSSNKMNNNNKTGTTTTTTTTTTKTMTSGTVVATTAEEAAAVVAEMHQQAYSTALRAQMTEVVCGVIGAQADVRFEQYVAQSLPAGLSDFVLQVFSAFRQAQETHDKEQRKQRKAMYEEAKK